MIEYIAKRVNNIELPKNVRQVGEVDLDKKVYIEDYAFSFIKEQGMIGDGEGRIGILLGEVIKKQDEDEKEPEEYIFVRGAMEVSNAGIDGNDVTFTEETWSTVNAHKKLYFSDMAIVGWYIVSSNLDVMDNTGVERCHIDAFGRDSILFYVNPADESEDVLSCFDRGLEPLDGYVVFFEKNPVMQSYMASVKDTIQKTEADEAAMRKYRRYIQEGRNEKKVKNQLGVMYGLSAVLVIVVLALGSGALTREKQNTAQIENVTQSTNIVSDVVEVNGTVNSIQDETLDINYADGNVEPITNESQTSEETSQAAETESAQAETASDETTAQETTEETTTETVAETTTEETTASYWIYTVKQGDTLSSILNKNYGSTDLLDKVLEMNGITDGGNSIGVGDELKMP